MKKKDIITVACVITIIICIAAFVIIYFTSKNEEFIYNKHLGERVLTIRSVTDGAGAVDVDMKEMAYYIINVEGNMWEMALQYDSKKPVNFWMVKVDKGVYTMRDYAKDWAMDSCIRDNILYLEAIRNNFALTDEEENLAKEDAMAILRNLDGKQMDVADFSYSDLCEIEEKLYLSSKYANHLLESGYTMDELALDGKLYISIKENYDCEIVEELWDRVKLGDLTVRGTVEE